MENIQDEDFEASINPFKIERCEKEIFHEQERLYYSEFINN
jgi:hypothetical protein